MPSASTRAPFIVACLCAQWCSTCRDYESTFRRVERQFAGRAEDLRFMWIDVEDQADLVDPIEVENFPTLLMARGLEPYFIGPLTPQPETLARLVRAQMANQASAGLQEPALRALVMRLQALIE
ncbi:MAG TPA: thioredoxin domain-containing protein [Rhizobacter sp.]|nr:thioredoxin domain-containing protein [Rhizobacter sp.]